MDVCSVCLDDYPEKDVSTRWQILECKHKFCKLCIAKIGQINITCPLCRKEMSYGFQFVIEETKEEKTTKEEKEQEIINLPATATFYDLSKQVKPDYCEIFLWEDGSILIYSDDCREHDTIAADGTCEKYHDILNQFLVSRISFNVVLSSDTTTATTAASIYSKKSAIPIGIRPLNPKQKCLFEYRKPNGQSVPKYNLTMFRHRSISDLYHQMYRVVFGSKHKESIFTNDEKELTLCLILRGTLLDPYSSLPLGMMIYPDPLDINPLYVVMGSPTQRQKKLKPHFQTCTGALIELILLEQHGIIKAVIYSSTIESKKDKQCAYCLSFFIDETTKNSIQPTQLNCKQGHPVHVECLIPNLKMDGMGQLCFLCHLCEEMVKCKENL